MEVVSLRDANCNLLVTDKYWQAPQEAENAQFAGTADLALDSEG